MSCVSSLPKRPDAAVPAHMRGIRCYEPRMRLLFGIESAALAHAADGRVLDPLNLAYQRDVDGCVDACFVWRAAIYDAFMSGQSIGLASNDQSKCFDRFQFGVQLLQLRLFYQPTGPADSPLLRFHRECMRSASARVRLPNTPKLGPRISVDGGAPPRNQRGVRSRERICGRHAPRRCTSTRAHDSLPLLGTGSNTSRTPPHAGNGLC